MMKLIPLILSLSILASDVTDTLVSDTEDMGWHSVVTNKVVLTREQQDENAIEIFYILSERGWSTASIAAACGNMLHEGLLNPGQWQLGFPIGSTDPKCGVGMVQYTPATRWINYCNSRGINYASGPAQVDAIDSNWEGQFGTTSKYDSVVIPFDEYKIQFMDGASEEDIYWLTSIWMFHFERIPDDGSLILRQEDAWYYYELFGGLPKRRKPKKFKPWLFQGRKQQVVYI